jgi:hypothetical protein
MSRLTPHPHHQAFEEQEVLRRSERLVSSVRATGAALGCSYQRIWLWRQGANCLSASQLTELTSYVNNKLQNLSASIRGEASPAK